MPYAETYILSLLHLAKRGNVRRVRGCHQTRRYEMKTMKVEETTIVDTFESPENIRDDIIENTVIFNYNLEQERIVILKSFRWVYLQKE